MSDDYEFMGRARQQFYRDVQAGGERAEKAIAVVRAYLAKHRQNMIDADARGDNRMAGLWASWVTFWHSRLYENGLTP